MTDTQKGPENAAPVHPVPLQKSTSSIHYVPLLKEASPSTPKSTPDPIMEFLRQSINSVLAENPTKPSNPPPEKFAEIISAKTLRHSILLQRRQVEKYIKYIIASHSHRTAATLTEFFAYFIEQINIAGTLFAQFFDHNKSTTFTNCFTGFTDYLLEAFTYRDEKGNHFTLDQRMHMLASCRKDFSSTKMPKFYDFKDFLTECDRKAKLLFAESDWNFYLSFHNYSKQLFSLVNLFESALWQRNDALSTKKHEEDMMEYDKYILEGFNALTR